MLEQLAAHGVVHNDIHGGNILLKANPSGNVEDVELVLIDFAFAEFFPPKNGTDVLGPSPTALSKVLLSPWQLEGHRASPRDDVFRMMETLAQSLSLGNIIAGADRFILNAVGDTLDSSIHSVERERIAALRTKLEPLFKPSQLLKSECCRSLGFSDEVAISLQEQLEAIVTNDVRSLSHPDTLPNYEAILSKLQAVLAAVS